MTRSRVLALLLVAALAGCGGDDDEKKGGDAPAAAAPSSETTARAERCGFPSVQEGATEAAAFPDGLLPEGAAVIRSEGGRSVVLLPGRLNDAYRSLQSSAQKAGLEIEFQEVETFDAELEIKTGDGVSRFAMGPSPKCEDVTRAIVTQRQG